MNTKIKAETIFFLRFLLCVWKQNQDRPEAVESTLFGSHGEALWGLASVKKNSFMPRQLVSETPSTLCQRKGRAPPPSIM